MGWCMSSDGGSDKDGCIPDTNIPWISSCIGKVGCFFVTKIERNVKKIVVNICKNKFWSRFLRSAKKKCF